MIKLKRTLTPEFYDADEQDLIAFVERGEWRPVPNAAAHIAQLRKSARSYNRKDKRINLRLSSVDYLELCAEANREGLPPQTFIASILHKYVTGSLVPRGQERNA